MIDDMEVRLRAGDVISPPMRLVSVDMKATDATQPIIDEGSNTHVGMVPGMKDAVINLKLVCDGSDAEQAQTFLDVCLATGVKVTYNWSRVGQPMRISKHAGETIAAWQRMRDE